MKVKESLNAIFDESTLPTKLSPLVDDDVGKEKSIRKNTKMVNTNSEEDESIEVDEIVNIKDAFLNGFINEKVYDAQPSGFIDFQQPNYVYKLKKVLYGLKQAPKAWLEDSKPNKTSMSTESKLTKDDEADSVDSSKYRGTRIETVVYADSDHAGNYVDRKSTSGVCTFMGCGLTSWFAKKQTALAISMTEVEYVSTRKACQQALWMKQALIDYDIRLDDVVINTNKTTRKYVRMLQKSTIDPNMSDTLRDIYRTLKSRFIHEGRTIDPSFYNDLNDDLVAKFTAIGFDCLLSLDEKICPRQTFNLAYFIIKRMYLFKDRRDKVLPYGMILTRLFKNLKANMAQGSFDEHYKLVPRKMSSLKAKQPKKPLPKKTRNVGKSKQTQLTTSSSTESPPSDNEDLPSTKRAPRSYHRTL
nr:copia protein [Tanacetum cinerariifolium]